MCVVSMVGEYARDSWKDDWTKKYPSLPDPFQPTFPSQPTAPFPTVITLPSEVNRAEFDALKTEVVRIRELLEAAAKFDKENNEPHCEVDDKVALLKRVAALVGVDLSEIFEEPKTPHVTIGEPIIEHRSEFIVKVHFMHGDADIYTDEELYRFDAGCIFEDAGPLFKAVKFLEELQKIEDGDLYASHPDFEVYGLNLPFDAHCGDYERYASIEEISVIYYDADGVAFSVIVDGD